MKDFNQITITDDIMNERIAQAKQYTLMILKEGPNRHIENVRNIIWEHGRRNFALRESGVLPIVCPVADGSDVCGIGIFTLSPEEVKKLYDEDPGVKQGVFVFEVHPCRGFPGSSLP
ncbi:MAG: hypothetical protein ACRDE2_09270 [Chitinophagaceae bacterium]